MNKQDKTNTKTPEEICIKLGNKWEGNGHGIQELDGENILAKDLSRAMKEHLGNSSEFLNKDINSS